jgi:hypothetical protein
MTERAGEDTVADWWRRWPAANVGVVTGLVSGAVVLDVDPRSGGNDSLAALERRFGALPPTAQVRTGGGGRHLWLDPGGVALPTTRLAPGLELKAEGGIAIVPPSRHASGGLYAWGPGQAPDEAGLAPLPPWLAALALGERDGAARATVATPRTEAERRTFAEAWARAGVELQRGDRYYLCPFHDDHRPSLHVDADACRWFCFGCGRGGGIGRLRRLLGETAPSVSRRRLRGTVGQMEPVTVAGTRRTEVTGESFYQDDLLELAGGRRSYGGVELEAVAELVPGLDTDRPRSVVVLIGDRVVGHLLPDDAERLMPLIAEARVVEGHATCRALIRGGWDRGRDDVGRFGVTLLLPEA